MKTLKKCAFAALLLLILLLIVLSYYQNKYGTFKAYYNASKEDCTATLPQNLRIVYNVKNRKYAVQIDNGQFMGKQYLWSLHSGDISASYEVFTTFSDSCTAKSFALEYTAEEEENEINNKNNYK